MMPRLTRRSLMFAGLSALGACSGPDSSLPPLPETEAGVYRLGPGDEVRIITFGEQQLTGEFKVGAAGDIALPLVGTVRAAGLTPRELGNAVEVTLAKARLYRNPSVSVEVVTYRPIFVLGEVSRPGQYPYQPGMTVVTAVAVAGGFTYRAKADRFSIVRTALPRTVEGLAGRQTSMQPGDVVTVYERVF